LQTAQALAVVIRRSRAGVGEGEVNRPGNVGGLIPWKDGLHGEEQQAVSGGGS
jgi:hypothetical protein